jgi:hypothetical protein
MTDLIAPHGGNPAVSGLSCRKERFVKKSLFSVLQHRLDSTGSTGTVEEASYDKLNVVDYVIDCVKEVPEQAASELLVLPAPSYANLKETAALVKFPVSGPSFS